MKTLIHKVIIAAAHTQQWPGRIPERWHWQGRGYGR